MLLIKVQHSTDDVYDDMIYSTANNNKIDTHSNNGIDAVESFADMTMMIYDDAIAKTEEIAMYTTILC